MSSAKTILLRRGARCDQSLLQRIPRQANQIDGPFWQLAWQGHEILGDGSGGRGHGCYPYEEGPALAGPGVFANRTEHLAGAAFFRIIDCGGKAFQAECVFCHRAAL